MSPIHIDVPDLGEDGVPVYLHLPDGEIVTLLFKGFYGTLDLCVSSPSKDPAWDSSFGTDLRGMKSKPCYVTNWIDRYKDDGSYDSSMHPAPEVEKGGSHQRLACQLVISAARNQDETDGDCEKAKEW